MFVTTKAKIYTDATGVYTEIPVLLTPNGVLEPLLDYCLHHSHTRSLQWMRKLIRAVELFLEYLHTNTAERSSHLLFRNFAQRLYTGTFELETGLDPTGLCWTPFPVQDASRIITNLSDFFDWLGQERPAAALINPRYAGSQYDRMTDEIAYHYRRNKAFLGHIWASTPTSSSRGRYTRYKRSPILEKSDPPAFPDARFEELLFKGFKTGGRYDYRGMLISLLLHGAGFRESEPFHLYISDVFLDPVNPRQSGVHIHHPTYGEAPFDWRDARGNPRKGNRKEYLALEFGIPPRTEMMGSKHAGWKGGTHDKPYYKRAYWFTPEYGEWFCQLWPLYLEQVIRVDRPHPFAFINLNREPVGSMYNLTQYNKAHAAACERIGLTVSKAYGTTPHGHRHAYGRRLRLAEVPKELIRRFMHHASIDSQAVYTEPSNKEILEALSAAALRMQGNAGLPSKIPPSIFVNKISQL